jgi:unsaturated rhamnogalacturonyl hydrolase
MKRTSHQTFLTTFSLMVLLTLTACQCCNRAEAAMTNKFEGATPLEWSVRMADSEVMRLNAKLASSDNVPKWDYTVGLFTLSLLKLDERNPAYFSLATNAVGSLIAADGSVRGYKRDEYQLDALNPGKTAMALYALTGDERYKKCVAMLRAQLDTQPRTFDGGFWHKERYTNQMWLDGIFMGAPFYAEYAKHFNQPKDFDDVAKQFWLVDKHLYNAQTGLLYHGWDAAHTQAWANPKTGASSNYWGRAVGWYAMACVDVLDFLPTNHPARPLIIADLKKVSDGIMKWQDADSGLWWQVMDQGKREGNYLEATASTMFVYAMAKGVNHGYLSQKYVPAILKGYNGIVTQLIKTDDKGMVTLTQCCQVAGLGFTGSKGRPRDGSFDYYVSEPIVENDLKGIGPFILDGIEVQALSLKPVK